LGGIGKTQSIAKYVEQHLQQYDNVIWIIAKNLHRSLSEILSVHFDYSPASNASIESLVQMIKKKTEQEKTLLIVDDASDVIETNKLSRNLSSNISLLVTTQIDGWDDTVTVVKIPCFDENETKMFLSKEIASQCEEDIDALANQLQSFPLAMQQAVSYINKYKISVASYVQYFKESKISILKTKPNLTDYNKTLLTVWDIAFDELKFHPKALLVLGMMAYMDRYSINKKTFLNFKDLGDELELNETIELLCEHSLVSMNENSLQIHALVQKVVQILIDDGSFTMIEHPRKILLKFLSDISNVDDEFHTDEHNLWYPHCVHLFHQQSLNTNILKNLEIVAVNRLDMHTFLYILERRFELNKKSYNESHENQYFVTFLKSHSIILQVKKLLNTLTFDDIIELDQEFREELDKPHPDVWWWKIQKASSLKHFRKVKESCTILFRIYEEVSNSKGSDELKVELAEQLMYYDLEKCKMLLNNIDVKELAGETQEIYLVRTKFNYALQVNDVKGAKQIIADIERIIAEKNVPSNHMWNYAHFITTVKVLLTNRQYQQAVLKIEECFMYDCNWKMSDMLYLKARALFRLKIYRDAKKIILCEASPRELGFDEAHLLCHVKFTQNDFIGIDELLSDFEDDEELLYWIKLYSMAWMDFNRQKQSDLTSIEKLNDILKCLVRLKYFVYLLLEKMSLF